ncbi:hypothetical protein IscW_ISCW010281 [Ixodes scapularis]|uniref:Uncharacterized protein n=1 Tax=Ixodes scapularis TaxID=6945 RepID=B7Q198_IXOSC|nr:hypothetical protein IscW_ISCW010281 [Ixodes scapularis]|eukprot:XP_002409135.1 hypothetical protein IscW_ISCW010281 [Ixodes scapularis]
MQKWGSCLHGCQQRTNAGVGTPRSCADERRHREECSSLDPERATPKKKTNAARAFLLPVEESELLCRRGTHIKPSFLHSLCFYCSVGKSRLLL